MLTIPNYLVKICQAIWLRAPIGLFFYLAYIFVRMFVSVGVHDHPYLVVICGIAFEATSIVIFQLLYGKYSVGRDINVINTFGLIFELGYLPFYFIDVNVSAQLNLAAKCLNGLIILRCFYLPDRDLFASFSPIEIVKKWLLQRQWFVNAYLNGLTVAVFALCAVPLCTMMYLINTDEMRASGIAIILFTFFVSFEYAKKEQQNSAVTPPMPAALPVVKAEVGPVAVQHDDAKELARAKSQIEELTRFVILLITIAISSMAIGTMMVHAEGNQKFSFGYAFGYADGKSGAPPKAETRLEKLRYCYDRPNKTDPPSRHPDTTCQDVFATAPPKNEPPKIEPPKK